MTALSNANNNAVNGSSQELMTTKQLASILGVSNMSIKRVLDATGNLNGTVKVTNGKTTYFTEEQVSIISRESKSAYRFAQKDTLLAASKVETGLEVVENCKKELLYKHSINLNARKTSYLNNGGSKLKLKVLDLIEDDELPNALRTAISLCENANVNIDDIVESQIE